MTDIRNCVEGETMELIGTITDRCPRCIKKEFHFVAKVDPEKVIPAPLAMMGAGNLDVVLFLRTIPIEENKKDQYYVFFRCSDSMCLLSHLRERMMVSYLQTLQAKHQKEIDQMRFKSKADYYKSKSRRGNRRDRARAKSNGQ
jgi:hypothetical protein